MPFERVSFTNSAGLQLDGRIDLPVTGEPISYAVYVRCFTCASDLEAIDRITGVLALHGIATLRFDLAGLGRSEGDFVDTSFSTSVEDLVAASRYLTENHATPEIAIGHSLGGAIVLVRGARHHGD